MLATLATGCGAVFVLAGTEVTMVAALRAVGEVGWTGIVTISMCLASAAGGVVYGAVHRTPGPLLLLSLLGLLAVPVGLVGGQWWVLCLALVPTNLMCAPTLASTADRISRLAPAAVRGEAMGLQSSALTLGGALGSPVVGTVVDHWGPPGGFAAAGIGGVLIAVLLVPLARRRDRPEPGAVDQAVPVSVTAN
jgi:predicted MFS family arabinose efflux permease